MDATLALALAAAVSAPVLAYITTNRKLSGKIGTSEASELWAESASIRDDYREQLGVAARRAERLEARIDQCETLNRNLQKRNEELAKQVHELEGRVHTLQQRLEEAGRA